MPPPRIHLKENREVIRASTFPNLRPVNLNFMKKSMMDKKYFQTLEYTSTTSPIITPGWTDNNGFHIREFQFIKKKMSQRVFLGNLPQISSYD
jgi:hypothetical protein